MFWILVLISLFSVCELSMLTRSLYQVEEGDNITLQWDRSTNTDLSSLHMNCRLRTVPVKLVFEMVGGVEETQSQDRQFSGRVQCDREALRLGQVQIHLTRLTPQDSGEYQCEMAANYNSDKGGWGFSSVEYFGINVTTFPIKPGADEGNEQRETPALNKNDLDKGKFIFSCVNVGIFIVACLIFFAVPIIQHVFQMIKNKCPSQMNIYQEGLV